MINPRQTYHLPPTSTAPSTSGRNSRHGDESSDDEPIASRNRPAPNTPPHPNPSQPNKPSPKRPSRKRSLATSQSEDVVIVDEDDDADHSDVEILPVKRQRSGTVTKPPLKTYASRHSKKAAPEPTEPTITNDIVRKTPHTTTESNTHMYVSPPPSNSTYCSYLACLIAPLVIRPFHLQRTQTLSQVCIPLSLNSPITRLLAIGVSPISCFPLIGVLPIILI